MTHDFHPEAQLEYRDAAGFYENRQPGLGTAFTLDVEHTIRRILEAPERWPIIEEDVRRCLTSLSLRDFLYNRTRLDTNLGCDALKPNTWVLAQSPQLNTSSVSQSKQSVAMVKISI